MIDITRPFALLHDEAARAFRLFTGCDGEIAAHGHQPVRAALDALARPGAWLAGGLSYEAGHALEPRLAALSPGWLWFGRFRQMQRLSADAAMALLEALPDQPHIGVLTPRIDGATFQQRVAAAQMLIAAGDIYQANLTFPADAAIHGHPAALFRRLWLAGRPPLGGLVHRGGGEYWLSLSPELFFRMADGQAVARPMKGTARRGETAEADAAQAQWLAADTKNRAENLMITDLIRNDLARVAIPGSVRVPRPLAVETYPSLHQLTSEVTAALRPGTTAAEMIRALFPCGSITGAPKIRAMQVIAELESAPRDIYCGAIGWIAPDGEQAAFNVAIRTLAVCGSTATLGLGAGIVADSIGADEWAESLLKAQFLHQRTPPALIETLRRTVAGPQRLARHLDRLAASARRFGFPFDRTAIETRIAALPPPAADQRLRLLLAPSGAFALTTDAAPSARPLLHAAITPLPVAADDWRLRHKSSDRAFLDAARRHAGTDEVIFTDRQGRLTEGSFTSLFIERDGKLLTPPARLGLLPGILRAELLASGRAIEAELHATDLADGFFLGNSLRGLMPAMLAEQRNDA